MLSVQTLVGLLEQSRIRFCRGLRTMFCIRRLLGYDDVLRLSITMSFSHDRCLHGSSNPDWFFHAVIAGCIMWSLP